MNNTKGGKKKTNIGLYIINKLLQTLKNRRILDYANLIDMQYVFWLKILLILSTIASSKNIKNETQITDL